MSYSVESLREMAVFVACKRTTIRIAPKLDADTLSVGSPHSEVASTIVKRSCADESPRSLRSSGIHGILDFYGPRQKTRQTLQGAAGGSLTPRDPDGRGASLGVSVPLHFEAPESWSSSRRRYDEQRCAS